MAVSLEKKIARSAVFALIYPTKTLLDHPPQQVEIETLGLLRFVKTAFSVVFVNIVM